MAVAVDRGSPVNIFDLVMAENNFSKRSVTIIAPVTLANKLALTTYQKCENSWPVR